MGSCVPVSFPSVSPLRLPRGWATARWLPFEGSSERSVARWVPVRAGPDASASSRLPLPPHLLSALSVSSLPHPALCAPRLAGVSQGWRRLPGKLWCPCLVTGFPVHELFQPQRTGERAVLAVDGTLPMSWRDRPLCLHLGR